MHIGPVEIVAIVALAIVVAPAIAGFLRLPGIIGFVIAGTIAGPYVLHLLGPVQIDAIGTIGLLYLMFQAGLEIDMATFNKHRTSALIFGGLTFTLPFLLGMAEGRFMLGLGSLAAVLIGSIWASHTLVTLPDVREAGVSSNRAVTTTAGATIITDTLALVVLALVTGQAAGSGSTVSVLVKVVAGLAATAVLSLIVMPWLGKRYFRGLGHDRAMRFAFLLLAMAAGATCCELFGIEGLVGAFVAGLGVNRLVPKAGPLMERVDFVGSAFLVPAFLIYVGTKLNPAVVIQPATVAMALGFMAALVAGKALAAFIGGRLLKFTTNESGLMLGMSMPQAAATLAATLAGAGVGLFDDRIVNAVVLVVLLSIIAGSLTTRFFARRVELPAGGSRPLADTVLVGLPAGTASVDGLMRVVAGIAAGDAGLVLPVAVATEGGHAMEAAEARASEATKAGEAAGADVESRIRRSGSYSGAILEAISDRKATMVVSPFESADLSLARLMGTELQRIGRESPVPVLAARMASQKFSKIVLGLDQATTPPKRLDVGLATKVALSLVNSLELPLVVTSFDEQSLAGLDFPEGTDIHIGAEQLADPDVLPQGALLVVPASLVRRFGLRAKPFAEQRSDVSILVVAGPHRLRLIPGVAQGSALMGWGGASLVASDSVATE
ncbi:MAG: cation:proton antiporter [Coriobacteriia bacterium]|nr:cation:proton antiporter [Coriobacteriia bacterium]